MRSNWESKQWSLRWSGSDGGYEIKNIPFRHVRTHKPSERIQTPCFSRASWNRNSTLLHLSLHTPSSAFSSIRLCGVGYFLSVCENYEILYLYINMLSFSASFLWRVEHFCQECTCCTLNAQALDIGQLSFCCIIGHSSLYVWISICPKWSMPLTFSVPTLQFNSVQFRSRWYQCCSGRPICGPPRLSLRLSFPNVAFETVPMLVWLTMALSRPLKSRACLQNPGSVQLLSHWHTNPATHFKVRCIVALRNPI